MAKAKPKRPTALPLSITIILTRNRRRWSVRFTRDFARGGGGGQVKDLTLIQAAAFVCAYVLESLGGKRGR